MEVLLSALPQVAPRIQVLLLRARPHRGEWVLSTDPLVALPPEASPLVGPLCQVLPRQVLVAQPIRESQPPVLRAGLLASPPQVG